MNTMGEIKEQILAHETSYLQSLKRIRKTNFVIMPLCILFQWHVLLTVGFSLWRLVLPTIVTAGLIAVWVRSHRQLTKSIHDKTLDIIKKRLAGEL